VAEMRGIPEIVELYATIGAYCMFLKIVCRDSRHLLHVLRERIQMIEGVAKTETFMLIEESIRRPVTLI
jgi:Lrp/AsnC family transcriptional regulator for asnA, asnC and gidA